MINTRPSQKEIAKSVKTLLVLLQSARGQRVEIILRDDSIISGVVDNVDGYMNVELTNVNICHDDFYCDTRNKCKPQTFEYYLLTGSKIRYVRLPEYINEIQCMEREIYRIKSRKLQWSKKDIVKPVRATSSNVDATPNPEPSTSSK